MDHNNEQETGYDRKAGTVGRPLPGVEVRLVGVDGGGEDEGIEGGGGGGGGGKSKEIITPPGSVIPPESCESGMLQVRGPNVFKEYWNNPVATREEFEEDGSGWFKTGDIAARNPKTGSYSILGRSSVDIIKSGGYKLSALDIERVLLENEDVVEVAVLGVSDDQWGQKVAAVVAFAPGKERTLDELRKWCGDRMAKYKQPTLLRVVPAIERNAMGKVNKKSLLASLF